MRRLLRSRRGAAMEMAILLSVITFALSSLVLTTALLQHNRKLRAERSMTRGIVLEQIGEDFCNAVAQNATDTWQVPYQQDYNITVNDLTLVVTDKDTEALLLRIVLTRDGADRYTVTEWIKK